MSMKFDRTLYWDPSRWEDIVVIDVECEEIGLKAEWYYNCEGMRNDIEGTINGREFCWDEAIPKLVDLDDPSAKRLLEQVLRALVRVQLLEWKLEEVTNA